MNRDSGLKHGVPIPPVCPHPPRLRYRNFISINYHQLSRHFHSMISAHFEVEKVTSPANNRNFGVAVSVNDGRFQGGVSTITALGGRRRPGKWGKPRAQYLEWNSERQNMAVYTTSVAYGWAGAVMQLRWLLAKISTADRAANREQL